MTNGGAQSSSRKFGEGSTTRGPTRAGLAGAPHDATNGNRSNALHPAARTKESLSIIDREVSRLPAPPSSDAT